MPEAFITYFGLKAKVCCDGNCAKAWGICSMPTDGEDGPRTPDDLLGTAPVDPGTREGADAKPKSVEEFPNKWCVRECERCAMSNPGEWDKPLEPNKFPLRAADHVAGVNNMVED